MYFISLTHFLFTFSLLLYLFSHSQIFMNMLTSLYSRIYTRRITYNSSNQHLCVRKKIIIYKWKVLQWGQRLHQHTPDTLKKDYTNKYLRSGEKKKPDQLNLFLDDCFNLWNNSEDNLVIFHQNLNNFDPIIKLTLESSDTKLPFLNVLVIKRNSKLFTDIKLPNISILIIRKLLFQIM